MTTSDELLNTTMGLLLLALLAIAVISDIKNHRIPNSLLLPALGLALLLHAMHGGVGGLLVAAGGLVLGLAMLLPLYLVGGLAAGDVKLLGVVGSFVGPWGAVVSGMATMMAGAVFGIAVIIWNRLPIQLESHAEQLPNTPGTGSHFTTASQSMAGQRRVTYIPYAPAIAVGTVAAIWYLDYFPNQLL